MKFLQKLLNLFELKKRTNKKVCDLKNVCFFLMNRPNKIWSQKQTSFYYIPQDNSKESAMFQIPGMAWTKSMDLKIIHRDGTTLKANILQHI